MPLDKLAPQSLEAEQSVLGSLLIDNSAVAKVADLLMPDDFYRPQHGAIYMSMLALYRRREPIDLVTLGDELRRVEKLDQVGGAAYLTMLMNETPTASRVEHYANIVRDKAGLRRLIGAAGRIAAIGYEEANDWAAAQDRAMAVLLEAVGKTSDGVHIYSPSEQGHMIMDMIEAISRGESRGIQTGIASLDHITGGLNRSELIVLAARPSVGKSAFAEQVAQNISEKGHKVAFFSIEMSMNMLLGRYLSRNGLVSSRRFINGLTPEEWDKLYRLAEKRSELPTWAIDSPAATSQTIRSTIERMSLEGHDVELVVVDYLQLIANNEPFIKGENKADRIGRITGNLKQLARQMNLPVLLLAQLNRESEHRSDDEPQLSDLRGSGDIEQDADVVLMMWREANPLGPDSPPNVRMKVAKQRNGPLGDVPIRFHGPTYKFVDA